MPASVFIIWLLAAGKLPNATGQTAALSVTLLLFFFLAIWMGFNWHAARLALERLGRLRAE